VPDNITTHVLFPELGLADPAALHRWAAVALFSSDLTTEQITKEPQPLLRPLVRAIVFTVTEAQREDRVIREFGDYPEGADARMVACRAATVGVGSWPLMQDWKVAR